MTIETLAKECVSLQNEKLDNLFQQARVVNPNIYVQAVPRVKKRFRWSNPFRPIVEEYDNYVMYRAYPDGRIVRICHDYNSLKSYFIGMLEGYNIACGNNRKKRIARQKKED